MPQPLKSSSDRANFIDVARARANAVLAVIFEKFPGREQFSQPRISKLRSLECFDSSGADQRVLLNPISNDALRMRLARRGGGERLEFLLSCWNFDGAGNSLQRFTQMRYIVDRFVRDHAERPVELPERCRHSLLQEWAMWSHEGRIPTGIRMTGLEAAAEEIHKQVADDPLTPFLLSHPVR